ncbi:MAG: MFS transporter [Candidatus Methanogranum gryphiswaldense]|nr:MAG: MFS transporter [Candidatus Methanogranum sp. U3.2.1]
MHNAYGIDRKHMLILFVVAFVSLADGMDGSIANIALPTLADEMGTDTGTISWVTVTYYMMVAGTILLFARIASNGAIRKILILGLVLFAAGSLMCGLSQTLPVLLIARVIQGTGAAMMGAAAPMICVEYLPRNKLGLGFGVITLGCSIGYATGPAIGGFIIDALSWHWTFFISVPLAIIVMPIMLIAIPKDSPTKGKHIDIKGAVILLLMTFFGIYALQRCCYEGEFLMSIIATVLFFVLLILFVFVELRKKNPILNVRVFMNRDFNYVFVAFLIINLVYMGMLYLIPFYLQINLGLSASLSGVYLLIPSIVTLIFVMPLSRKSDFMGRRLFSIISCILLLVSCLIWVFFSPLKMIIPLIIAFVLMGLTWSTCGGAMASRIVEKTENESREMGSSLMNEAVYIGCAVGTALYAMIFIFYTGSGNIDFADLPPDVFLKGFVFTLIVSAILCAIALFMSTVVKDKNDA